MNILSTMSLAGYISIIFVLTAVAAGLIVLLLFVTRHERRRYKRTKLGDGTVTIAGYEEELNARIHNGGTRNKFTAVAYYIEDMHGIKAEYDKSTVDAILAVVAKRLIVAFKQIATFGEENKKKLVAFFAGNIPEKKLSKYVQKSIALIAEPIAMPGGKELTLDVNAGSVYYPKDGMEPIRLMNSLDLAIAASRRRGVGKYVSYIDSIESGSDNISQYHEYMRLIGSNTVGVYYRKAVLAENMHTVAVESALRYKKAEVNQQSIMEGAAATQDDLWLSRHLYQHSIPRLRVFNLASDRQKKMIIRLCDGQLKDDVLASRFVKILANNDMEPQAMIATIDMVSISRIERSIADIARPYAECGIPVMISNVGVKADMEQLSNSGVKYIEVNAKDVVADPASYGILISKAKTKEIAIVVSGVDDSTSASSVRAMGADIMMGEVISEYLTAKEFVGR